MTAVRGITWDHPRAYQALEAFQDANPSLPPVTWNRQPLAGFEAHPIADLAERYDLIVVDHPGLGTAVAENALLPLDSLFDDHELAVWGAASIGSTWQSYRYLGRQWALPIDASTQVSVLRPDLLPDPPATWKQVLALPQQVAITLCLGGPHALLQLLAMCATDRALLPVEAATEALAIMQQLWRRSDRTTSLLDPIGVHEALAGSAGLAYCPLAYGYAHYGQPESTGNILRWADAPTALNSSRPGTVLGGTGLAVARRSAANPRIPKWIRAFMAPSVQAEFVPGNGGQPAHRLAWTGPGRADYYSATVSSMLSAWTRPREPGWISFQNKASEAVRDCVTTGSSAAALVAELNRLWPDDYRETR